MTPFDRRLLDALEDGLPIERRPYAAVAVRLGIDESEVIARLRALQDEGAVSRFGVVVRHHELGWRANAMVVWDVPDDLADRRGESLAELAFVSLSYRRPRRPPVWPYNLFCMIHGRERETVLAQIEAATVHAGLQAFPRRILFSRRQFKQRGARYGRQTEAAA
jgi:DNA-binding Lrp family transcriptional regulator